MKHYSSKPCRDGTLKVRIRLNDPFNSGCEYFAITGEFYRQGRLEACGCLHDEIAEVFPEFKLFILLHLADQKGIPMYAVENGFYFLKEGNFKNLAKHLRASNSQMQEIRSSEIETEKDFAALIKGMGFLEKWEKEANEAISILESLTGEKFESKARRTNWIDA
jgi:hypothetical protein